MAVIPIQAATLGHIPGGPYCVVVMGLLKCGATRGGRVRQIELPELGKFEIEHPAEVVDVTGLAVLVSALASDLEELRGRIIDEKALRDVEDEIAALFDLLLDF